MCEKCKPVRVDLLLSVTTAGDNMSAPLSIHCDLTGVSPDATGYAAPGMHVSLDPNNAKFVRSFLVAALEGVDDTIAVNERAGAILQ